MAEYGLKYEQRPYTCMTCGHEKLIGTNHTDVCFDRCPNCSWRGGTHATGEVYHPSPTRAFQYGGDDPGDKALDQVLAEADELLPRPPSAQVRDLQSKAAQSRTNLARLRAKTGDRPGVLAQIDDLNRKMSERDSLLGRLKYNLEVREAAAEHGIPYSQISALIPHRSTPFGQTPRFVVGLMARDGRRVMFERPIDVHRPD